MTCKNKTETEDSSLPEYLLITRGSLVSEIFSLWLKSPKKSVVNYPEHYPPTSRGHAQDSGLAPFGGI